MVDKFFLTRQREKLSRAESVLPLPIDVCRCFNAVIKPCTKEMHKKKSLVKLNSNSFLL
jgi:hypothetical protein